MGSDSRGYYYADSTLASNLTVASGAITATASIEAQSPTTGALFVEYDVTAVSGTAPTLNVAIELSQDNGVTWHEARSLPQITAAVTHRVVVVCAGDKVRIRQTVGGTSPSFTRSVTVRASDF